MEWNINGTLQCQTIYPPRDGIKSEHLVAISSFNTISTFINISVNIFLIYSLCKLELIRKTSYKFIFCLCIGDGCVGLLTQPTFSALLLINTIKNKCIFEIAIHSLQTAFSQFSVLMILIITMDRFLHMTYLTRYNTYMTKKRGLILIATNIIITMIIVVSNIIASIYKFHFAVHTAIITINTIIFIIIFIIYTKTYLAIRSRVHDSSFNKLTLPVLNAGSMIVNPGFKQSERSKIQHHQNFGKAMIFVLLTLGVCYLPYFSFIAHISYLRYQCNTRISNGDWRIIGLFWSMQFVYLNSTANALIVIASSRQLRQFTSNCFKGKWQANNRTSVKKRVGIDPNNYQRKRCMVAENQGKFDRRKSRSLSI